MRFDHHPGDGLSRSPTDDPARAIYYAALTLSGCVVEIFGDRGSITIGNWHVARSEVSRQLTLLDLRGSGAMRAGSVAALAKVADRSLSQAWSRYFYETTDTFGTIDGIVYHNAHNDEDAVALYERARDALSCPPNNVVRLDDESLRPYLLDLALKNNLDLI
jgi:hypothetical protein